MSEDFPAMSEDIPVSKANSNGGTDIDREPSQHPEADGSADALGARKRDYCLEQCSVPTTPNPGFLKHHRAHR